MVVVLVVVVVNVVVVVVELGPFALVGVGSSLSWLTAQIPMAARMSTRTTAAAPATIAHGLRVLSGATGAAA
ncbi:hypothetical protein, partial [Mycobacterium intermedium]|uniref:hypothetical protein n=1 Tax=Mycobacterium intermedium TaxID=28445 RepID=UPI0039E91FA4